MLDFLKLIGLTVIFILGVIAAIGAAISVAAFFVFRLILALALPMALLYLLLKIAAHF